jgi:hypothetical protein
LISEDEEEKNNFKDEKKEKEKKDIEKKTVDVKENKSID